MNTNYALTSGPDRCEVIWEEVLLEDQEECENCKKKVSPFLFT